MNTMNLLWAFEFGKGRLEDGTEIEVDLWGFYAGVGNDPYPFVISPKPRSERHEQLVLQNFITSAEILRPFEHELCEEDRNLVNDSRQAALEKIQSPSTE